MQMVMSRAYRFEGYRHWGRFDDELPRLRIRGDVSPHRAAVSRAHLIHLPDR